MQFDYFYGSQAEQFSFYRIPKVLFTDPQFKPLSTDAKVLYGILLDRMNLSVKNQWLDEQSRVYIIFTTEEIMEALSCAIGGRSCRRPCSSNPSSNPPCMRHFSAYWVVDFDSETMTHRYFPHPPSYPSKLGYLRSRLLLPLGQRHSGHGGPRILQFSIHPAC